jgi:hypothetical protein
MADPQESGLMIQGLTNKQLMEHALAVADTSEHRTLIRELVFSLAAKEEQVDFDEGNFKQQLEIAKRLDRVDTALAKRLSQNMARNAALKNMLQRWLSAYPLDIFPEPDLAKAAELLKAGGQTLDAISASNMRHTLQQVLQMIAELEQD